MGKKILFVMLLIALLSGTSVSVDSVKVASDKIGSVQLNGVHSITKRIFFPIWKSPKRDPP
jgi:hypothetical protein